MAQRYPTQYNGILATAPAFNWDKFVVSVYWPQFVMQELNYWPSPCELNAFTSAAIESCDLIDQVKNGIISNPDLCKFDPYKIVGKTVQCTNPSGTIKLSKKAAQIAALTWAGPRSEEAKSLWYGPEHAADFSGLAGTQCTSLTNCTSAPFPVAPDYLRIFLIQNATVDWTKISHAEYDRLFRLSVNQYASVIGTGDPDLTDFMKAGGKLLTWHGTADQLIPFRGTIDYYERVLALDPKAADYYRLFLAPGIGHCYGGPGWYPGSGFDALIKWVEEGVAPERLPAQSIPLPPSNAKIRYADLCPYPLVLTYNGGNPDIAKSYTCKKQRK